MTLSQNDQILCAEYVLGTLPAPERAAFAERLLRSAELRAECALWDGAFDPMAEEIAPVRPPARVLRGVERRLFVPAARSVWRWLGPLIGAALASVAVIGFLPDGRAALWTAEMVSPEGVRLAALYDEAKGEMRVSMAGQPPAQGRDFELWLIPAGGAAISLGVMPRAGQAAMPISEELQDLVAGAVMAITEEPLGGSPTGVATGALVAKAPMIRI